MDQFAVLIAPIIKGNIKQLTVTSHEINIVLILIPIITQGNKIRSTFCLEGLKTVSRSFFSAESRGAIHFWLLRKKPAENAIKVAENAVFGLF